MTCMAQFTVVVSDIVIPVEAVVVKVVKVVQKVAKVVRKVHGEGGEGGDGGGGGDVSSVVTFRELWTYVPRRVSGDEEDRREAVFPRLLAMTAARWLVCVAAIAALNRFIGCGLALRVRTHVSGVLDSLKVVSIGGGCSGGGCAGGSCSGGGCSGGGCSVGGCSGGGGVGTVTVAAATPVYGIAGGASLLLSSLRLALLARSRLLLPEW